MNKKTTAKQPRRIWLLFVAILITDLIAIAFTPGFLLPENIAEGLIWIIVSLIFALVGCLILARQPRHVIGWLLMVLPITAAVSGILDLLFKATTLQATQLSIPQFLYIWFSQGWSWWLLIAPIFLIFLLYPTGRLLSKNWRWAVAIILADFMLFVFIVTFADTMEVESGRSWLNPIGFLSPETLQPLLGIMSALLLTSTIVSVLSVFLRYRKAPAVERAQIKWLFFACVIFFIVYSLNFISQFEDSFLLNILFMLSILAIPVSIGIAILRYRLWDIDFVINRSLIYAILTTLLAAIFAGTAAVLTQVAKAVFDTDMQQTVAAVAAIVVASLFQPLRTAVENFINRRLFPENVDLSIGLIEINPDLWSWISLPQILTATLDHLQSIYSCDVAAVYLKKGAVYKPVSSIGVSKESLAAFLPTSTEEKALENKHGIVHENEKPFITTVPIYLARRKAPELLGVLRLGKRLQGRGYSGDDIKTLVSFGSKLGQPIYALTSK